MEPWVSLYTNNEHVEKKLKVEYHLQSPQRKWNT